MTPTHAFRMDPTQRELADRLRSLGFSVKELTVKPRGSLEAMTIGFEVTPGVPSDAALLVAFEVWGAAKDVPAWKVRAAECMHGWGIGKQVTAAQFDEAIRSAETAGPPRKLEIVEQEPPAPAPPGIIDAPVAE